MRYATQHLKMLRYKGDILGIREGEYHFGAFWVERAEERRTWSDWVMDERSEEEWDDEA